MVEQLILAGKNVYFLHDVPVLQNKDIILMELVNARHNPKEDVNIRVGISSENKLTQEIIIEEVERLKQKYPFKVIDSGAKISDVVGNALIVERASPIYLDNHHLTDYGSLRFREIFLPLIHDILAEQQGKGFHKTSH